jgi:hypothetical protein
MREKVLVKSKDFLAGYMYKTLERDVVKHCVLTKRNSFLLQKKYLFLGLGVLKGVHVSTIEMIGVVPQKITCLK